jgi:triacylglycerol esterase/lipase EstA (alpha/beta hydrolase family)
MPRRALVAATLAAATLLLAGQPADAVTPASPVTPHDTYTVVPTSKEATALAEADPTRVPNGANLSSCHSDAHPYPVVLLSGTFATMEQDFAALAPTLANDGYCVYTLNYGGDAGSDVQAVGPMKDSATEITTFIDQVLSETGASKVDLIGHSQGGTLAEYYAKYVNTAAVHSVVGLAPTTHGTTMNGFALLAQALGLLNLKVYSDCPACVNQEYGSDFITNLDDGAIAQKGVSYTVIETQNEDVVTPVGISFIDEDGVTNEYVQTACADDTVDHQNLTYDQAVFQEIRNALDPSAAAAPDCSLAYPHPAG